MFLGDRVRDQFGLAAIFEELSSSPAGMEASRFCDFYGRCFGNVIDQADAVQAYTQSELPPGTTYIKLPGRYRKELLELGLIEDDNDMYVIPLDKALYGHPQSGAHWEEKCEKAISALGFQKIGECSEWRSCY